MDNPAELKILIGMHRAVNKIDGKTIKIVKQYGLSLGQFAVLEALYHKGDMTVGQVQEKILSSSGTIPVIIKNLEKSGYVNHKADECDKRKCMLHITDKGADLIKQVFPENKNMIIESFKNLSYNEKDELLRLLKSLENKVMEE